MAVSRNEMEHAASMVKAISDGKWTEEPPSWVDMNDYYPSTIMEHYTRAVQTAEAFIVFFQAFNPRFDVAKFLVACGLQETAAKRGAR